MNIKEIKFLMERIESNKRLTDTEYRQKHQDLLKENWFRAIHKDDGIDIEEFYNYSQKPDPKMAEKFKGKFLHLDDLIRSREGQELMENPKLSDAIKKLGIKLEMRKTEIDHPQILAKIIKTLVKPGVLNFDELVKTPDINKGLKDNSNWTQEVLNKVAPREGMEVGDLGSYAQRLVNPK